MGQCRADGPAVKVLPGGIAYTETRLLGLVTSIVVSVVWNLKQK